MLKGAGGQTGYAPQNQNPIYNAIAGAESPTIAQYLTTGASALGQLGEVGPELGIQNLTAQQQYQTGTESISNQLTGNQISQQGIGQQLATEQAQNALSGTENSEQYQNTTQQLGLEQALLGTQEQVAGGVQGLAQQTFGIQQGQLNYALPLAQQAQSGAAGAAGATTTVGNRNALGTIQEQYGVNSALLQNQSQQSALNYQGQQAGFQEQGGMYALQGTEAGQQFQNTAQGLAITGAGEATQAANQQAQLANTAAGLGISQQQLQNQLASGLAQNEVTAGGTVDSLMGQISQAQAGETQGLGATLSNIGAATGLGPQAFSSLYPNLYGG